MTVKIGFEFDNHDEALVFLARVSSTKVAAPAKVPAEVAGVKTPVEPTANKSRKPRNDAGKPRGEYKKVADVSVDGEQTQQATKAGYAANAVTTASAPALTEARSAPREGGGVTAVPDAGKLPASTPEGSATPTGHIPETAPGQPIPTEQDCKDALTKVWDKAGKDQVKVCQDIFARFAVKRIGELPKEHYAEFVAKCEGYLNGEAV